MVLVAGLGSPGSPGLGLVTHVIQHLYIGLTAYSIEDRSKKFLFADDKVLALQTQSFEAAEMILERDLMTVDEYYTDWRLKPNPNKTEVAAFHLNNREANKQLKVRFKDVQLCHNSTLKYLGIQLDRSLTFKPHIEKLCLKLNSRNNIKVGGIWLRCISLYPAHIIYFSGLLNS